jgi:flagellar capping protein FliD
VNGPLLEADIAVLKNTTDRQDKQLHKMEVAIEKMTEVSNAIARMLAIHEEKLNASYNAGRDITELVERRRVELSEDIKKLHNRIDTVSEEVTHGFSDLELRMQALQSGIENIQTQINNDERLTTIAAISERVTALEQWKWYIAGGLASGVAVFYAAKKIFLALFIK